MKNIVFILMDQLRANFVGCYGGEHLKTPNIDELAGESVKYEQAISPSPLCVPARASLLTGMSSIANRVTENSRWLRPDHDEMGIHTWPKQLSDKGYYTNAIGKMHFYPWDINEGFKEKIIAEDKRHIHLKDDYALFLESKGYRRMHGEEFEHYYEYQGAIINTLPEELQIDKFVADNACNVIGNLKNDEPFALMIGFPGPHCPYDPTESMMDGIDESKIPAPYKNTKESESFRPLFIRNNKYDWNKVDYTEFPLDNKMRIRKHYSGLIQKIDDHVGSIVSTLKEKGLYDDTVIVLAADHGDLMGDFDILAKHFFFEGSIRVPLMIKYPGQKASVVNEAVSLTDLYATLLGFADIEVEDTTDSTMLKPFGRSKERESIFGATDIGWMIRDDRYKYCICDNDTRMLYDIKDDPMEQNNLIYDPCFDKKKDKMEKLLYRRLFGALEEANHDLVVTGPNLDKGFYQREWKREYPKKV